MVCARVRVRVGAGYRAAAGQRTGLCGAHACRGWGNGTRMGLADGTFVPMAMPLSAERDQRLSVTFACPGTTLNPCRATKVRQLAPPYAFVDSLGRHQRQKKTKNVSASARVRTHGVVHPAGGSAQRLRSPVRPEAQTDGRGRAQPTFHSWSRHVPTTVPSAARSRNIVGPGYLKQWCWNRL